MKTLELLSPAKDLISGMTAINFGADAVYIGAEKFGARAAAGNSVQDIEQLIKYAHKYYAKVYAALNTIFRDEETEQVRNLIIDLYNAGADALIIQDMGILQMQLPPIPIHASTQTNNYSLERIKFLENCGISRIILARELSLDRIKFINQNTNIELESFIYGALCVSLSGQCYISQASCGRSANRGECAQICRHKFDLLDKNSNKLIENKHLLSLKDFNLENYIAQLSESGISSFKIEGRLKDLHYVKNVTAYFRKKIDEYLNTSEKFKKSSSGTTSLDFNPNLENTFNRDFTEYFINSKQEKIASFDTPKYIGSYVGTVKKCMPDRIELYTIEKINNGDGLSYFNQYIELCGFRVNKSEDNVVFPAERNLSLTIGTKIYRNQNIEFERSLQNSKAIRKIRVEIIFDSDKNIIQIIDEDNCKAELIINNKYESAESIPKAKDNIIKQLSKSGDSCFKVVSVCFISDNLPFIPISELNQMRRDLLDALLIEREENRQIEIRKTIEKMPDLQGEKLDYKYNIMNSLAESFYEKCGAEIIDHAPEKNNDYTDKVLMTTKYCIRRELGECLLETNKRTLPNELYLRDGANQYKLEFDCKNCFMLVKLD